MITDVAPEVTEQDRRALFRIASVLLTYPDDELLDGTPEVAAAVARIEDAGLRGRLAFFLVWFGASDRLDVQQHYVRTFDLRRSSGLNLTYHLHGDTRKRGVALLTLKQRYRAQGFTLDDRELPDFLPVVLEYAAALGPGEGEAPLRQHRRGVELLLAALDAQRSPYAHVVAAVAAVLPPLTDADREALALLAHDGPPVERVGLAGYGDDAGDELAAVGVGPAMDPPTTCPEVHP